MIYKGENILTVPNVLSAYRLISIPFILAIILLQKQMLFFGLIVFNQFTDFLDGFIARRYNLRTRFGSRLDSLADSGTYVLAILGILVFKMDFVSEYRIWLSIFLGFLLLRRIISIIKFGKHIGLHILSVRIASVLQYALFIVLFTFGAVKVFVIITIVLSALAFTEEIVILMTISQPKPGIQGLYWLFSKKHQNDSDG